MTPAELLSLFQTAGRRTVFIGNEKSGCIAAPDLEGRLYYVHNGEVVSRVNAAAVKGITNRSGYLNPGGDGLSRYESRLEIQRVGNERRSRPYRNRSKGH